MKPLIEIIDLTNDENVIEVKMAKQDKELEKLKKMVSKAYQNRKANNNKGFNFPYWNETHDKMIENGWKIHNFIPFRQWGYRTNKEATSSVYHAKLAVEILRSEGNYARIICGMTKNVQRIKMYSVIYKPKQTSGCKPECS